MIFIETLNMSDSLHYPSGASSVQFVQDSEIIYQTFPISNGELYGSNIGDSLLELDDLLKQFSQQQRQLANQISEQLNRFEPNQLTQPIGDNEVFKQLLDAAPSIFTSNIENSAGKKTARKRKLSSRNMMKRI